MKAHTEGERAGRANIVAPVAEIDRAKAMAKAERMPLGTWTRGRWFAPVVEAPPPVAPVPSVPLDVLLPFVELYTLRAREVHKREAVTREEIANIGSTVGVRTAILAIMEAEERTRAPM